MKEDYKVADINLAEFGRRGCPGAEFAGELGYWAQLIGGGRGLMLRNNEALLDE